MNSSPLNIPSLLKQYGLRPDKALGQNFLVDEAHLEAIVREASVAEGDQVLEVGAGLGSLTRHLAAAAQRVVAVELDEKLLPPLRQGLAGKENVEVVSADILALDVAKYFKEDGYRVVANIPYYLTSRLIRRLLESRPRPGSLALTVQREVAERACAQPPQMSLLALSVQVYGEPRIAHRIPAGAFYPAPSVDSALLLVEIYEQARLPSEHIEPFFNIIHAAFQQKRKTLANSLSALPEWDKALATRRLEAAAIDARRRPQTLNLEEWGRLLEAAG